MNRQRAARFPITSLHLQQGLWTVVALLVTLAVGQQLLLWHYSQQPEAPLVSIHRTPQTHFSPMGSVAQASASMRMMDVDQAQPIADMSHQERWVF